MQETQRSQPFGIILALATNHGKSSQTHLVFLPSSSKDLTAKCARNTKIATFWNNFGACNKSRTKARKHTWYFYQVVRKTSLQSVQETKRSQPFGIILALATNHGKSSQTHLVFLPSSSKATDTEQSTCFSYDVYFRYLREIIVKYHRYHFLTCTLPALHQGLSRAADKKIS